MSNANPSGKHAWSLARLLAVFAIAIGAGACAGSGGGAHDVCSPVLGRADIHSVPEFLAALPESLRSRYVLMFRTRSPDIASYEAPRVIFYSEDAKEVVAFAAGTDRVDLMRFDDRTSSFVLREVTFPELGGQRSMTVSEPNPERCRACHGSPPRPVWDTYPLWPGAYGETPARAAPARERSGWASFSRLRSHDARYRYLVDPKETALDEAARRYTGAATVLRNAELSELFGALNAKAVASELRASPRFNGARDALLIALATPCGDIEEALPEDARASFRRDYDGFARGAAEANAVQDAYKAQRAEPPLPTPLRSLALAPAMIRLRYVAEHELGVSSAGWTLALEKGSYDFASAARPAESFERKLFAELAGSDERLLAVYWNGSDTRALCSLLREPGRVASGGSRLSPHGVSGVEARPEAMLVERCASCHEGGAGPPIPFGDPARLAPELARSTRTRSSLLDDIRFRLDGAAGAERMPVGFNPTPEARAQLLTYLSDLSKRNVSIPRR